jgi:GGDEF domain-containing protein
VLENRLPQTFAIGVLFIDLDRFEMINDTHRHGTVAMKELRRPSSVAT